MDNNLKILIDYGGTISKDQYLFDIIDMKSKGNDSTDNDFDSIYIGPDSWDNCRQLGCINYFDEIENSYFSLSKYYNHSIETINSLCVSNGVDSETLVYIVYDNRPRLNGSVSLIEKKLAHDFQKKGGRCNGIYVESDKLMLCKKIGANVLIEDDPRIALSIAGAGIKVILMLRKWNAKITDESYFDLFVSKKKKQEILRNFSIAEDWEDAENILKKWRK